MEWERAGRLEMEGMHAYKIWLIHVVIWQKPTQHCKAIIFQLKEISFKKKTLTISQLSLLFSIQLDFYKFSILPIRVPANLRTKTQNKGSSDILKGVRLKEKNGRTSLATLPMQGVRVQFLVGELRSHMPSGVAKREKERKVGGKLADFHWEPFRLGHLHFSRI